MASLTIETIENGDSTMDAVRPGYHDTLLPESGDSVLPESGETALSDTLPIFMHAYTPLPVESPLNSLALSSITVLDDSRAALPQPNATSTLAADPRSIPINVINISIGVVILLSALGVGVLLGRLTKRTKARNNTTKSDDPRARLTEHQDHGGRPPVRRYINVPETLAIASGEAMLSPAYLEEHWANMQRVRQRRQRR